MRTRLRLSLGTGCGRRTWASKRRSVARFALPLNRYALGLNLDPRAVGMMCTVMSASMIRRRCSMLVSAYARSTFSAARSGASAWVSSGAANLLSIVSS